MIQDYTRPRKKARTRFYGRYLRAIGVFYEERPLLRDERRAGGGVRIVRKPLDRYESDDRR